jgi:hypothetical protein
MDANEPPEPVPEPVPDIVLHPGDTIATGAFAGDRYVTFIRLLDRSGVCYAVLDGERDVAGHGWRIHAIRSVSIDDGGRGVLPVRADSEPDVDDQSHLEPLPLPLTIANAYAATVAVTRTVDGRDEYRLSHHHSHNHGDALPHAHDHIHTGADAHRAGQYGHGLDPHTHPHPPDAAA